MHESKKNIAKGYVNLPTPSSENECQQLRFRNTFLSLTVPKRHRCSSKVSALFSMRYSMELFRRLKQDSPFRSGDADATVRFCSTVARPSEVWQITACLGLPHAHQDQVWFFPYCKLTAVENIRRIDIEEKNIVFYQGHKVEIMGLGATCLISGSLHMAVSDTTPDRCRCSTRKSV